MRGREASLPQSSCSFRAEAGMRSNADVKNAYDGISDQAVEIAQQDQHHQVELPLLTSSGFISRSIAVAPEPVSRTLRRHDRRR
jgi:hypothetical protein